MRTPPRRTRWRLACLSVLTLAAVSMGCGAGPPEVDAVVAEAEVIQTAQALTMGGLRAINGTYGAGCLARAGSWSVLVSGTDALVNPALSVVKNDTACSLTVTSLVADQTYTGVAPIMMTSAYQGSASAFHSSGSGSFYANAKLDSTSFASNFVMTLLVSSDPTVASAGVPSTVQRLGTASTFAIVAGSTVTSTGPTVVTGDICVSSSGSAITGFPPATITGGTIHLGDSIALKAQADVLPAYEALAATHCDTPLTGQDLGGLTLTPGVYCFSSSAALTGQLVLDAQGDANAAFTFQIVSTLTTSAGASVVMTNGGRARNVFWQVGTAVTIGASTALLGNLLAATSVTFGTAATLTGRALVLGAVTMDSNIVSVPP